MATYYSGAILINSVKMEPSKATLVLGFLGVAGWFFMLGGCFYLMERVGRVNTMVIGAIGCCIGQVLLAVGVAVDTKSGGIVAATGLYLFLCIFSGTHLPTAFVYSAEIVPLAIRARAAMLGVATQYIFNFCIVVVTPVAIKRIGWAFYCIFAIGNALMVPAAFFLCPETADPSLKGIDQLFDRGKVRPRRGVKGDLGGHLLAAELGKDKGSFEHMEKVDTDKLAL
ncbi:hypothetical protein JCM10207_005481 [Rhodosporidiobolus poonsookiae]